MSQESFNGFGSINHQLFNDDDIEDKQIINHRNIVIIKDNSKYQRHTFTVDCTERAWLFSPYSIQSHWYVTFRITIVPGKTDTNAGITKLIVSSITSAKF